jgi:excinuclease ABC subunit C
MHFLQRLRDEAHRYAIDTHRARRQKSELTSPLDGVPGIGPRRKKALLAHFGSARAVSAAGLQDLEAVDGISKAVARQIFDWFYSGQS